MIYSLFMSTFVTAAALFIGWKALELPSGTVTALCALWSIELSLGAFIKVSEGKELSKKVKDYENEQSI